MHLILYALFLHKNRMPLVELRVPNIGESISEVTLAKWLKEDGAMVAMDEPICVFESDKATFELPCEKAGRLRHIAKEGDDLSIGAVVATIDTETVAAENLTPKAVAQQKPAAAATVSAPSPAAAKILREKGIPPTHISGTGKDGRITKADALAAEKKEELSAGKEDTLPVTVAQTLNPRRTRRVKLSRMRRTIASRLVSAKNETAMLTTFNEADMQAVIDLRNKYNELYQNKYGIKIGFMSLFAKACAQVLLEMPEINAHLDGEELIYHDYVDISMAISTPNGLVVPPIHNVESLPIWSFEKKLKELAEKARAGKLSLEEMSGGTFTITNGGVFGSLMSTPIINGPQSAILGLHAIKERPVAVNGQVVVRPMMYLALSYDHRVIDGSSSVTFLVKLKERIEDPMRLFLEV